MDNLSPQLRQRLPGDDQPLGLGRLRRIGQGCDLILLQSHWSERLHVAGMVALDVLRKVALVAKPLQTGFEETSEWLLSRVLPLVGIKFRLGEKTFPAAFTEELVVPRVSPHVAHEIPPVDKNC